MKERPITDAPAVVNEPPCTCGRGTVFYSHLHDEDCPFFAAGVLPPKSKQELELDSLRAEKESLRAAAFAVWSECEAVGSPSLGSVERLGAALKQEAS